jgi:predicted ATPase/DNA-binding winged helix-turn-helix (wHTH) protein
VTDSDLSMEFAFGRFMIRPAERRLLVDGKPVVLGGRAFDLLLALTERRDRVVSKNELLDVVWAGRVVEENNLQVQISTLRRILGPETIATVPGRGYQFTAVPEGAQAVGTALAPATMRDRSQDNLPESTSTLYGRDEDLAALLTLLGSHRLVTLTGAGGIGKSTLALAAARAERERWDDGVWLIELMPVADPALVPAVVAQALGIQLAGRKAPRDEVADALRSRKLLLLLDSCEHLLAAVTEFADTVLARSQSVKILATSQEPLHIAAEQQVRVPPLALPADADARNANPLDYGALALFEARVQAIDSRFRLDDGSLDAAIEICRRLDCLPLAIELAAARVPLLGIEGIRGRLDDRFRILTTGLRAGLSRHQTLRAAIEWSHSLLTAEEQAVFRRLAVFCGSFGLDAAQRVASDAEIDEWTVLDHLGALVDKSLVAAQLGAVPRYRLLETSRALACEKLEEAGEADSIRRAHAQAVLAAFERAFRARWRQSTQSLLDLNLPDLDNLRAAFEWASRSPYEADLLIALAGASAWLWRSAGLSLEGLRRCTEAMARITALTPAGLEARLQLARATFMFATAPELRACERAIELYRRLDDREELFHALILKAQQLLLRGDLAAVEEPIREAEELSDPDWPFGLRFHLLRHRAFLMDLLHRWDEARAINDQMLRLARESGDSVLVVSALALSMDSELCSGNVERAVALGREMLELSRRERLDCDLRRGEGLAILAAALVQQGQLDEALQRAREATQLMRRDGSLARFLDDLAMLAFKLGRSADAARALGRAETYFVEQPIRRQPGEQRVRDSLLIQLRRALPQEELTRYLEEGAAMSDEDATRAALGE